MTVPDGKFPKEERIVKTGDLGKVYRSGASFSAGPFVLKVLPSALERNRIGFSISARNIKSAVKRNRIRRLFREAFRRNKQALKKSFDVVLVARREAAAGFSYNDAEGVFLQLAKKSGIWA